MQDLIKDNAPWAVPVTGALLNKIFKATGLVITRETPEKIGRDVYIEEIKKSNLNPLMKAAFITNGEKIIKEYMNQNEIVKKAIPLLTEKDKPECIDEDWLMAFMDRARLVSDSEFQIIWAKILAEECKEPGKISKQLLMILSQMDREDANAFTALCKFCVNVKTSEELIAGQPLIIIEKLNTYYVKHGITLETLRNLNAFGLIDLEEIPANCFGTEKGTIALSVNCANKILAIPKECERLRLGGVTFKKAGKELFKIVSVSPQEDFWEELALPYFESCW